MREGEHIKFYHNNTEVSGRIIKIYTQIGFSDHGFQKAVISLDNCMGLFSECVIDCKIAEIKIIEK